MYESLKIKEKLIGKLLFVCMYMCVGACTCVYMHRGQRKTSSVLLNHSQPYSFDTESLTEPGGDIMVPSFMPGLSLPIPLPPTSLHYTGLTAPHSAFSCGF